MYLPETSRGDVEARLTTLFRDRPRTVSRAEMVDAQRRFAWEPIITGFWERVS